MNFLKRMIDLYCLKRQEKFHVKKMESLQDKKLRKLLHYTWEHSTYYQQTFEQAGITKEQLDYLPLSAFPTMNKNLLIEHFHELVTEPKLSQEEMREFDRRQTGDRKLFKDKYHIVHSSGSTGKPGYFVYDENAWNTMILGIIRAALWKMSMPKIIGLLMKRPRILYIAATDGRYGGAMAVGDGIDGVGASQMFLDIKTPLKEWKKRLNTFRPHIVIGYPSAIKIMAELVEKKEVHVKVKRVVSCGEPLGPSLRSYLEKKLQAKVVNVYGASESLILGVEMSQKEGMLLFDDLNIIQVEEGVMYLTCLYNYLQPLIRYRLSDQVTIQRAEEGDVYPFTKAKGLLGRKEDILWFQDKRGHKEFLHPLAVEGFCIPGLKDYQFRQTAKDAFEMYAETAKEASTQCIHEEILKQMRKILEEKDLGYVQFYVKFVKEILPDEKTGKKPLIVQEERCANEECDIAG